MIRVLLVDDHAVLRESLVRLFDREDGFEVAAHAGSLAEARGMLEGVDLAIVDLDLPDGFGTDLIKDLHAKSPQALALVLTGLSKREQLALAIEAGAGGVLRKSMGVEEIVAAARRLCAGETLLSHQEIMDAVHLTAQKRRQESEAVEKLDNLTPREKEVLRILAEGSGDKEIAAKMQIEVGTVRAHVESILRKLEAASRLQAVVFAARRGAVKID